MKNFIERFLNKDIFVLAFIFLCLMIAFSPSFLFDYFRHDDWASACWDRVAINTHHLFQNSVVNEFRPYTMIFIYYSELFTEYLSGAKFVKIGSIIILSISSLFFYKWLKIFNVNSLWALFLSVMLFVLPPMQIMASTYQYFFMVVPILLCSVTLLVMWDINNKNYNNINSIFAFILFIQFLTIITLYPLFILYGLIVSAFFIFLYYTYRKSNSDKNANRFLYASAFIIYFTAITAYPMSAMFVWFLLAVPLLLMIKAHNRKEIINFCLKVFTFSAATMVIYFLLGRIFAYVLGIDTDHARGMSISSDLSKIFYHTIDAFRISSNLWDIKEYFVTGKFFLDYNSLIVIITSFIAALCINNKLHYKNFKLPLLIFCFTSSLVFFTIAPLVLSNNGASMYRYLIALTPLIGFIFLYSLSIIYLYIVPKIKYEKYFTGTLLASSFIFMIYLSNQTLLHNIVIPNQYEMDYISDILDEKVIPKIKNNEKVVIHHVQGKVNYTRNRYSLDEYSVSMTVFKWPVLAQFVMLLKDSNINTLSRACFPSKWEPNHGVFKLNWGTLELFTNPAVQKENSVNKDYILIDMDKLDYID